MNILRTVPFWPHVQCENRITLSVSTVNAYIVSGENWPQHRSWIYHLRLGCVSSRKLSDNRLCSPEILCPFQCKQNGHDNDGEMTLTQGQRLSPYLCHNFQPFLQFFFLLLNFVYCCAYVEICEGIEVSVSISFKISQRMVKLICISAMSLDNLRRRNTVLRT